MKKSKKNSIDKWFITTILIALSLAILTSYLSVIKQQKLLTSAPIDTGIIANLLQNILAGKFFISSIGFLKIFATYNMLETHSFFILLFIAPFYYIFNSINFLFILQSSLIYFSSIPVYLLAKQKTNSPLQAFFLTLVFIFSPILYTNSLGEVHIENLAIFFFLMTFYFLTNKNFYLMITFSFLSLFSSEVTASYFIFLGITLFLFHRNHDDQKYPLALTIIGIFWIIFYFLVIKKVLIESDSNGYALFNHNFSKWALPKNATLFDLMGALVEAPIKVLQSIFVLKKWIYVYSLVNLFLLTTIINYKFILVALPSLFYFLMDESIFFHDIHSYYFNFLLITGVIGLIETVGYLKNRKHLIQIFLILFLSINLYYLLIQVRPGYSFKVLNQVPVSNRLKIAQNIIREIPLDAGVISQHRYTYYLANRKNFFILNMFKNENLNDQQIRNFLKKYYNDVHYILVDLVSDQPCHPIAFYCYASSKEEIEKRKKAVTNLLREQKWKLVRNQEGVILLAKN